MIFTESTIKISNNVSKMDSTIVLYRGDKNVEIRFTILQSPFKYSNTVATNVIESTNASYGQLVIKTPNDKPPIFSEVSATKEGTVLFTITKEMIDEIEELGNYTFQIRLLDENKQSRVTIPPVENGIEIKEPIAIEDDNSTNVVGLAKANYAVATLSDTDTPAFDDNGKYIKTNWNDGDIITNASLNKIEDGIYTTNENVTATKKYVDDNTPIKSFPVNPTTKTAATVDVNNITSSGCYALPKRADGTQWTNLRMRAIVNDGSGNSKVLLLTGYQNFVFHVNIESKKIYCDNLRIVYNIGTTADTTYIDTEPYYLSTTNTKEYTPTNDYNPATKKYVDDKITVKILPVDYNKNCATNVADLEPHSIYMSPNDAKFLYLGYEKLDGSFSGLFLSGNPHGKFIYTGAKDDTKIEVMLEGICHTAYFKTDTVDPHTEKTVFYLTKNNTTEFTPTTDYEPATKKYVDDNKIPYTISSKVLATIPASDIKLDGEIAVNNISINKDRIYYIEFLGSKKLCSLLINGEIGDFIICSIGNYSIEIHNNTFNISIYIDKINISDTTDTFTDLVIYEEEVKYLDSKYLETDLVLQNSISLGRVGDIGAGSSAIGNRVTASGNYAHAEGGGATALGDYSHAEGSNTTASGYASHAEGSATTASGVSSHAEGDYTTASGASSHAEGYGTKASSQFQHVQGKYNIEDKDRKYAHIVGNGAGDAKRSNAHALDWKGNGWYAGKLSQEGTPTDDKDLATKKYVDDNILLEQLPILRIDETNKRIYVNCNNMGTYKKYFVPNKYANVYGFSFIYTNEDSSETEIALVGGAMTRDDFILCARNTDTLFILILGGTDKYTYTKSTKTLEKGLYGYLKIGNTQEYTPTNEYNPATKKYVDDKVTSLPQLSFNEAGELVVTINGVSKTFVPKNV